MRRLTYYVIRWEDATTKETITERYVSKATYYRYRTHNQGSERTRFYDLTIYHYFNIIER